MALITSSIITTIKGSIGGTTFSSNRSGMTAKRRITGKRTLTQKQSIALNQSIAITNQWNSLPNLIKVDWNNYALANAFTDRFGVVKMLTGYQWFKQINTANFFINGTYITTAPPAHAIPTALPTFTVTCSSIDIIITFSLPINTADTDIFIYSTIPTKANAKYNRAMYRLTPIGSTDYTSSFSVKTFWEATHNMSFSSVASAATFLLNFMIIPINKTSFVTGLAQTANGSVLATGIGFMSVGSSFKVG